MSELTTITLAKETVEKLKDLGKKGQTYDQILQQLLNQFLRKRVDAA